MGPSRRFGKMVAEGAQFASSVIRLDREGSLTMPSTLATAKQPQRGAKTQHASLSAAQRRALRRVLARPVRYVPNALFRRPGQMAGLMDESVDLPAGATLSKQQERLLFLQMNYARLPAVFTTQTTPAPTGVSPQCPAGRTGLGR